MFFADDALFNAMTYSHNLQLYIYIKEEGFFFKERKKKLLMKNN